MTGTSGMIAPFLFCLTEEKQEDRHALIAFVRTYMKHNIGHENSPSSHVPCFLYIWFRSGRLLCLKGNAHKPPTLFFLLDTTDFLAESKMPTSMKQREINAQFKYARSLNTQN